MSESKVQSGGDADLESDAALTSLEQEDADITGPPKTVKLDGAGSSDDGKSFTAEFGRHTFKGSALAQFLPAPTEAKAQLTCSTENQLQGVKRFKVVSEAPGVGKVIFDDKRQLLVKPATITIILGMGAGVVGGNTEGEGAWYPSTGVTIPQ